MVDHKNTAAARSAWIAEETGALEEAAAQEPTRELQLCTRRTSGFFQSETEKEGDLEERTVVQARPMVQARPRLPSDPALLTGPPEPLLRISPKDHGAGLPTPGLYRGDGEPTGVKAYAREVEVIELTKLVRRPAPGGKRPPRQRSLTGPPVPLAVVVRPPSSSHRAEPPPGKTPPVAAPCPDAVVLPSRRRGRRKSPIVAAPDSFSRICWNVTSPPPVEPTPRLLARISWRKHRTPLAAASGALGIVALLMLLLLSGGQQVIRMEVISSPPGARVLVNGELIDQTTPALVELADVDRRQVVEVSLADYRKWRKVVTLSPQEPRIQVLAVLRSIQEGREQPVVEPLITAGSSSP